MTTTRFAFLLGTLAVTACAGETVDKDDHTDDHDEETDLQDTDTEDTDVEDTDVDDTDVADTDSAPPCAVDGTHVRVVLDPNDAEATFITPRGILVQPRTQWRFQDETEVSLPVTASEESTIIVEFDPPMTLQRAPSSDGYILALYTNVVVGGGPLDNVDVPVTTEVEGTLPSDSVEFQRRDNGKGALQVSGDWEWSGDGEGTDDPAVGDTLTCLAFTFTSADTGAYTFNRTAFTFWEQDDTSAQANPLVAP